MGFACRKDVIIGFRVLQDPPHPLDIVARMPPVAPGIEIPEKERLLATELDRRYAAADFSGDKVSPRVGPSWLNRIPFDACRP